jgi:hypothetical protein
MERVLGDPDDEASGVPSYGLPVRLPAIGDQLDGGIGVCFVRPDIEDVGLVGRLCAQMLSAGGVDCACAAWFFREQREGPGADIWLRQHLFDCEDALAPVGQASAKAGETSQTMKIRNAQKLRRKCYLWAVL